MKGDKPIEPMKVKSAAMKTLAERISNLTPAQRSLFEIKTRQLSLQKDKPRIPKRQDPPPWPASTDQAALWFIQQLEPSTSAYNIGNGYRLHGKLDVALLERCLNIVAQRHEILRTRFLSIDGQPYQVVSDRQFKIPVTDVRHEPDPESAAQAKAAVLIQEPFDLENGPTLRLPLLQVADDDHMLIGVLHHIVTDWWSYHLFFTELFGLYTAFAHNRPNPLPELPIQFADWAAWRDQWERSDAFVAQESYWLGKLEGIPYAIEIPADRPRPKVQSHRGAREFFVISPDQAEKVRGMNRRAGVSSFMTFLAAINAFVFRYTGQQEFLIGTPVSADRDTKETANLIGYLLNILVLRADLTGNPNFLQVLERVRGTCIEAFAHKDFPFRRLVERLKPDRDMSRMPLYQVEYVYTSAENPIQQSPTATDRKFELPECEIRPLSIDRKTSPVDLQIAFTGARDQFSFMIEYNSDIFDGSTVRQMGHQMIGLLENLLNDPLQPVATIPLLGQEDRTVTVSNSSFHPAEEATIVELFQQQVARTPEATAAICGESRLTYSELNERANHLAHYLRGRGVGPEVRVGVWLPRSLDLVVALLGILKAGGAYVPLDTNYPEERVSYMLEDSQAPVLLTLESLHSDLRAYTGKRILLDTEKEQIARESIDAPSVSLHPENLAYLIYTSGSTGKPKAVAIRHHSVATFLHWVRDVFTHEELRGVLASTSICFDMSVFEIFGPVSWGGTTILVNNALDLAALSGAEAVTLIDTVPAVMTELVHMRAVPNTVMTVNLGGEALPTELVRQVYQMKCVERVYNLYGPSEDTTFSSFELVRRGEQAAIAPVGVPVKNTEFHVLNGNMQPVLPGESGELYIGGDGLARGYLNRPALTAERFVPDPFSKRPGARLYYTGDRMRYLADGRLEYLGRTDHQVKIRGYRIELGEIEAALNEYPGIARAVVLAREDISGQKRLVAYLVAKNKKTVRTDELRSHMQKKLPEDMVPSLFVILEQLPLTPNGKVDRSAFPEPEECGDTYRAPRSPREAILCEIFAEVLERTHVGIDDNFFTLGGHSLTSTRLVSRIRAMLDVAVPVRAIFEAPTVAELVNRLDTGAVARPPLVARSRPEHLPLSYAQQRLWFIDRMEETSTQYNVPEALRLRGELNIEALKRTLHTIMDRHESLRTHFEEFDGNPVQIVAPSLRLDVPVEDLSRLPGILAEERITAALQQEWEEPLDLAHGPLLRVRLLKLGEKDHILLRTFHHIVYDGWSLAVLNREFSVLYEAFCEGRENPLPPLTVQYPDFALWQRRYLGDQTLSRDLQYWKQQLMDIPGRIALPKDRSRPAMQTFDADVCQVSLSSEILDSLKQLGYAHRATLYMSLLSVFAVLLQRYSGQNDIVIGSPIADRREAQLERLIGLFVNSLLIRVNVYPGISFRELLHSVRRTTLEAFEHQDLPFERLVEELSPQRSLSITPLHQVMFALQNSPVESQQLARLEVERVPMPGLRLHFDLELYVWERDRRLEFQWVYNRDLFAHWRIEQMARHYVRLLAAILATPDAVASDLEMLTVEERRQILSEWNRTDAAHPRNKCLHHLVEEQAERTPDSLAVTCGNESLTYAELNQRANQVAHSLRRFGAGPEARAGICLERTVDVVVGLLGILKSGSAYVPLDPAYPQERMSYMLEDSQACLLLTQSKFSKHTQSFQGKTLLLDGDQEMISSAEPSNPGVDLDPRNLAYVIYTSGSTGKPKGVAISHQSAALFSSWARDVFSDQELCGVLASTSVCFDLSIFEIFVPLSWGGRVIVVNNALDVATLTAEAGVTLINTVPSVITELLRSHSLPSTVQVVNLAGEALHTDLVNRIYRVPHVHRVFNLYGPSEDTTYSTYECVRRDHPTPDSPIGRPIANTQAYVLDQSLNPVPAGVAGDLYLGGDGLARGYLNRPELTAERFLPDPWSGNPGSRLYCTGDLARYLPDGRLEFLGRNDHQVKIRGFRIELGEVEAALKAEPGVQDALVTVRETDAYGKQLIGYVVTASGTILEADDLRGRLRRTLPEYIVPSAIVVLSSWPLLANGKIDRQALPDPSAKAVTAGFVVPESEMEKTIASIWQRALHLEKVSIYSNFFDLGGHSLLTIQIHAALKAVTDRPIAVTDLFKYPTIASLAKYLAGNDGFQRDGAARNAELEKLKLGRSRVESRLRQRLNTP